MTRRLWGKLYAFFWKESRVLLAGGRDVYETTRQSFLSLEARAGAAVWGLLLLLSLVQMAAPAPYPFDPGPAFRRMALDAATSTAFFCLLVVLLHLAAGAVLGIFLRNAWELAEDFLPLPPRRGWSRRLRWSVTAALLLLMHGGFLLSAIRANPGLYAPAFRDWGGPARLFQDWLAEGFLSWPGRLWTLAAGVVMVFGLAQMLRRFHRWFMSYPMPVRVANGVVGVGTFFFLLGLWGVFRFHRPQNEGPNILVLAVEGLRTGDLKDDRAPALGGLAHRGRAFASCVPTVPQREASLMTLLTGRSPLSHGVRHAFPAGGDVELGPDALPGRLKRAGYRTAALSDAGGDLLGRLSEHFDRVRAPDLSTAGLLRRDILRRSVHLLPYLRGRTARRLLPPLRAIPALTDPLSLAEEGGGLLKQLRFRQRFFLLVHVSGAQDVRAVDGAVGHLLRALDRLGLEDSTWVALWSPFAASAPGEPEGEVASPSRFAAPLVVAGPLQRTPSRWVAAPARDVDVAPTLLSAAGLFPPESMEGLPLLDINPDADGAGEREVYTETDVWMRPDQNPLPPELRLPLGPPSSWLEEDPEAPGRLRVRPSAEDALLAYRHRLLRVGRERLVYRPSRAGVLFEFEAAPGAPAGASAQAERVKELKEVLFQELRREAGWWPQNDFWIPEALMREKE